MDERAARRLLIAEEDRLATTREGLAGEHLVGTSVSDLERDDRISDEIASDLVELGAELAVLVAIDGELAEVRAAVGRLDAGDFGHCEVCRSPIPDERLEATPATRYCTAHETMAEVHHAAPELDDIDAAGRAAVTDRIVVAEALDNLDLVDEDDPATEAERESAFTDVEDLAMHLDDAGS